MRGLAERSQQQYNWPIEVQKRLGGDDYPLGRDIAESKLRGITAKGKDITEVFDKIKWPVKSPSDLGHQIKAALDSKDAPEDRELPPKRGGQQ